MTEAPSTTTSSILPNFHLLCMEERFSEAFNQAVTEHYPDLHRHSSIKIHNCSLKNLDPDLRVDAVVSPANSYARLDGAFDDALARAYGPRTDYFWITRKAQKVFYRKWKGFAPPGTCTIVRLDHEDEQIATQPTAITAITENPWGTEYLLMCPTMAIPADVRWDKTVVYECIWSMLCVVDEHNQETNEKPIRDILIPPLATGIGKVSPLRWAQQCVLAMKHWVEANEKPEIWGNLHWDDILQRQDELEPTYADGA